MRIIKLGTVSSGLDMFNDQVDEQTTEADEIEESFDISGYNCVVCFNNYGTNVNFTAVDNDLSSEYFNEDVCIVRNNVSDFWDYCFAPVRIGIDTIFYFEAKSNATGTIKVEHDGFTAKCGLCLPGVAVEVGKTSRKTSMGVSDFSIITTNPFGLTYLSVGDWAKRAHLDLIFRNNTRDTVKRKFDENVGIPGVYDLNNYSTDIDDGHTSADGFSSLVIYGYSENFRTTLPGIVKGGGSADIQGFI